MEGGGVMDMRKRGGREVNSTRPPTQPYTIMAVLGALQSTV